MPKRMLVSTLGTSPAVVTEAIDLLTEQGQRPDGVTLIYTSDTDVKDSYNLLCEHLPKHDGITWIVPCGVPTDDVDSLETAVEFLEIICQRLKSYKDSGYQVFVSIAGGRKVMSALTTLAVQLYGAHRLFHIWVPPWLEKEGDIDSLRHLPEDILIERLHPPLRGVHPKDRPHLVDLPFIGLFPLLGDIVIALRGREISREIKDLLVANGLLTPQGETTELGKQVVTVLEQVESLPPARLSAPQIHISEHHYKPILYEKADSLVKVFSFITRVQSIEWRQGENKVIADAPNRLRIYWKLKRGPTVGLLLETTAQTEGQLESARRCVERYVKEW